MESRIERATHTLASLRANLRSMQKTARRMRKQASCVCTPTMLLRLRTVLLFCLCGDMQWTMLWAATFRHRQRAKYSVWQQPVNELMIQAWVRNHQEDDMMLEAMSSLDHPWRIAADTFLIETLVYEDVLNANGRNLEVPSTALVDWYVRKWTWRPRSAQTDAHLQLLQTKADRGRQWASRFRKRWGLQWGSLQEVRTLSRDDIRDRAAIYVRWIGWTLMQQHASTPTIIIAMDETSVTNLKGASLGTVVHRSQQSTLRRAPSPAQRSLGRTALLACVCNDADLQPYLPQVWLPRTEPGKVPPAAMRAVFTASGAPHEAWHGSRGFVTQRIIRAWLSRLRRRVHQLRPGANIVVVMDVCPVHVAEPVLAAARRMGVTVVLIPARLTWLLQLLDTHVFAQVKREMRRRLWLCKQSAPSGTITVAEHMAALTEAVTVMLVRRSWSHLFARVCLDGSTANMRPGLHDLLQGVDLTPRRPTEKELATCLGAHRQHVQVVHRHLFPMLVPAPALPAAHSAASANAEAGEASDTDPVLGPLLSAPAAGAESITVVHTGPDTHLSIVRLARGRRLFPCPRNLLVLPEPPAPAGERVATRSPKRPLLEGVVGAPKRSCSNQNF